MKAEVSLVRSSAAEYLTFVAAGGDSDASVEMRYEDENIWLTQKMMAALYDVSVPAINQHLKRLYSDNELEPEATVKKYLIVQTEGSRQVQRSVEHYSLQAIIAVGFKIENERAVQFRKWANQIVNIGRLGKALERLPPALGPGNLPGCGQSDGGTGQGPRRKRVREIPHRAGPAVRVGFRQTDQTTAGERG